MRTLGVKINRKLDCTVLCYLPKECHLSYVMRRKSRFLRDVNKLSWNVSAAAYLKSAIITSDLVEGLVGKL